MKIYKGRKFVAEAKVADTFLSQAIGLMGRLIKEDEGLVLSLEVPEELGIWMVGMKMPIDLVFLDEKKKVVQIYDDLPPFKLSNPATWKTYYPPKLVMHALEIYPGRAKKLGLKAGDVLKF